LQQLVIKWIFAALQTRDPSFSLATTYIITLVLLAPIDKGVKIHDAFIFLARISPDQVAAISDGFLGRIQQYSRLSNVQHLSHLTGRQQLSPS
jgi:hypothetical protein